MRMALVATSIDIHMTDNKTPSLRRFFLRLRQTPEGPGVFNPWADYDPSLDAIKSAPRVRSANLRTYLSERLGQGRFLLIAEALGYQGGRFSGIPMTSERIVLGHQGHQGVLPQSVAQGELKRTSQVAVREQGFAEPTATIVWKTLLRTQLPTHQFVLWNAFAWHPYDENKGLLSNRTPSGAELLAGAPALETFLALFPEATVIAVGAKAQSALAKLDVASETVRHPSRGGARQFESQLLACVKKEY